MNPSRPSPDSFDFNDLFVLDLANNHQGDLDHGLAIIRAHGAAVARHGVRAALKFQFRELDSFIHPDHRNGSTGKHIDRFQSTRLGLADYQRLFAEIRAQGMLTMCTPFDEASAAIIAGMGFDIIKVASCSAADWPLLEAIAQTGMPTIFSTGGLLLSQIDELVSFFDHRGVDFAMMHCVAVYPTPDALCHLNNIETLLKRYPGKIVGWSTHEDPADTVPVQLARAKGARLLERHVGLPTETVSLNAYSSTPEQIDAWIAAWRKAGALLGSHERQQPTADEADSIASLQRGVFANGPIARGEIITRDKVYFAMPYVPGALASGDWKRGIRAEADVPADAALPLDQVTIPPSPPVQVLKTAVHEVKAMLNEAGIVLGSEFEVEYSHHYGVENFRETGTVIINCINREYCKKVLVQLPGQAHPAHFHKRKEETFQIVRGELHSELDGRHKLLQPGDTMLVLPGVWHRFWSETGCVFEEISTTHYNNDSVYRDAAINAMERHERKTVVDHWGRFQLDDTVATIEPVLPAITAVA
jgi:sialic acid synthase SpsE/quercetin dioxygenase-like cupin family protein